MLKAKEYGVEDSNVEGLGGDEDRALKKKAAQTEPAWRRWEDYMSGEVLNKSHKTYGREVVMDKSGLPHHVEIWRIEKFKVKFWPREQHGQFYSGDSYLILHTFKEPTETNPDGVVRWDLHFWLGKDTTQDEMGTAAYKTVELDTLLDDGPVQRREVQEHESELFMTIFSEILSCGGLRYLDGGVDSGFRHVEPESYQPRLMHVKGRRKVRVLQKPLRFDSLNSGDLFILDAGLKLFVWKGNKAGMFERNKGRELSAALKTERKGKAEVINLSEGETGVEFDEFASFLEGSPDDIRSAEEGGADEQAEKATTKVLFRVSDATGSLQFTKEGEGGAVSMNSLDRNDCFVLDVGYSLFVWVGKGATQQEKDEAIPNAQKYLKDQGKPDYTPIVRVLDGAERTEFKQAIGA